LFRKTSHSGENQGTADPMALQNRWADYGFVEASSVVLLTQSVARLMPSISDR
jgi:hypothetical protein